MKRILLTIMFCLFLSSIANAKIAWVLWWSNSNDGYFHWQVVNFFPSYEECKQAQRIKCEWAKKFSFGGGTADITVDHIIDMCPDYFVIFYIGSSHERKIDCKCLPVNIDPRK
jgi:hypothetical protein